MNTEQGILNIEWKTVTRWIICKSHHSCRFGGSL